MKEIGFDATLLRSDFLTGIERYIVNFLFALSNADYAKNMVVFVQKGIPFTLKSELKKKFKICVLPSRNRILLDHVLLPYYAKKKAIFLMHFPAFGASPFYRGKHILTIHDATFWRFPNTISFGGKYYYKPLFGQSIRRAEKIITVSQSSAAEIGFFFPAVKDKIRVIYEALDKEFSELTENNNRQTVPIEGPYILTVGTLEPRKNLKTIIEAYSVLKGRYNYPHKLVVTGRSGWLDKLEVPVNVKNEIVLTGYVSEPDLVNLYKNASLYVFPSLYEGFGFPLLEAMKCGVPIVSSNSSSLPEIGKDACLYAHPSNKEEWIEAIIQATEDITLRQKLVNEGYKVVSEYSWERNVRHTLYLYEEIYTSFD